MLARIRPGAEPSQILAESAEAMRPRIDEAAFPEPYYKEAALRTLAFPGHLSHTVGMAVHDVGSYISRLSSREPSLP